MDVSSKWFAVIRNYRGKRRVIKFTEDETVAKAAYDKAATELRDGDLGMYVMSCEKAIAVVCGGYNRTRW